MNRNFKNIFMCCAILMGLLASPLFSEVARRFEYAKPTKRGEVIHPPWLTGPLLAPSAHVIPPGHWNIEPYLFATTNYGSYNGKWKSASTRNFNNYNVQVPIQYGLCHPIDLEVSPQFSWNRTRGVSEWVMNDLPLGMDIQLLADKKGEWWPAIKFSIKISAPLGKYQKLDPKKFGTDAGGAGGWSETVGIAFSRIFQFSDVHYLDTRLYCGYTLPNRVHVKDLNAYGGGKGTNGKVHPGHSFVSILGMEYTLTQNWALACDLQYQHENRTRFHGKTITPVGSPSSEQFSLAPAIEYNWSANLGLIAGAWFSFAGRNAPDFVSGVIAINMYR